MDSISVYQPSTGTGRNYPDSDVLRGTPGTVEPGRDGPGGIGRLFGSVAGFLNFLLALTVAVILDRHRLDDDGLDVGADVAVVPEVPLSGQDALPLSQMPRKLQRIAHQDAAVDVVGLRDLYERV